MKVRDAAALYISRGWYPLPLKNRSKDLRDREGLEKPYLAEEFGEDDNVGLKLIPAQDERAVKLVAVDFDAVEITPQVAWTFLPRSSGWGRASKKLSQVVYVCPLERSVVHQDLAFKLDVNTLDQKATLLEVRAAHQSMCPPSVHPCGETLAWVNGWDDVAATEVEPKVLTRAVALIATYCEIARYYNPPGRRHHWGLYLAGFLHALGLHLEESEAVVKLAAAWQSQDKEVKDRLDAIKSTYARPEDDPVAGSRRLAEEMGDRGKQFVATLRKVWGAGSQAFVMNDHGDKVLANSQHNVRKALERMKLSLKRDVFSGTDYVQNGDWSRVLDDEAKVRIWLEVDKRFGFRPSKDFFYDVIGDEAGQHPFHPVTDYLSSLRWDGRPRVDEWLHTYGGARSDEYTRAVASLVLIAAVKRVRHPGCKFDEIMILESPQGLNKSTALRGLCPSEEWFSDDLPLGVDAKQVIERTAGRWIVEVAELVGSKREVEHLKASLSRQVDGPVRLAYARTPVSVRRQFIIIGTTNSQTYLKDMSGNRRFWPVRVGKFDVSAIVRDRDQLWAEAAEREARGESIRLDEKLWVDAGRRQDSRRLADPWEATLAQLCENAPESAPRGDSADSKQRITHDAVWTALGIPVAQRDERGAERIANIMQRLGFRRLTVRNGSVISKGWGRDLIDGVWKPAGWEGRR